MLLLRLATPTIVLCNYVITQLKGRVETPVQNSKAIMRSANTPETEKNQVISNTYNIPTVDGTLVYAINEQVLKDAEAHL